MIPEEPTKAIICYWQDGDTLYFKQDRFLEENCMFYNVACMMSNTDVFVRLEWTIVACRIVEGEHNASAVNT